MRTACSGWFTPGVSFVRDAWFFSLPRKPMGTAYLVSFEDGSKTRNCGFCPQSSDLFESAGNSGNTGQKTPIRGPPSYLEKEMKRASVAHVFLLGVQGKVPCSLHQNPPLKLSLFEDTKYDMQSDPCSIQIHTTNRRNLLQEETANIHTAEKNWEDSPNR